MRLSEVMSNSNVSLLELKFCELYHAASFGDTNPQQYVNTTKQMMEQYPQFIYNGEMYRTVGLRASEFKFQHSNQVAQFIKQQNTQRQSAVESWASKLAGVFRYDAAAMRRTSPLSHVRVILQHKGQGFDLQKYSRERGKAVSSELAKNEGHTSSLSELNYFAPSERVYEVLNVEPYNVEIHSFLYNGNKYTLNDFNSLLQAMQH